jgi:DNA-directed RNA polymerase specialized sigma24 family protein
MDEGATCTNRAPDLSLSDRVRRVATNDDKMLSDQALTQLCKAVLLPRCRLIVGARLSRHRDYVDDVVQDVIVRLVQRLQQIRAAREPASVQDAKAWVAGAALRACSDFLRKQHPLRTHLAHACAIDVVNPQQCVCGEDRTVAWCVAGTSAAPCPNYPKR